MTEERRKILIVEDDTLTLQLLSDSFRNENFFVIEAVDGKEAVNMALRECPDIILLDIIIPEIDGIEVLKRLRTSGCCMRTPIIVMTNLEGTEIIDKALSAGKCDFIMKTDWSVSDIIKRVNEHMGHIKKEK